ncbi:MAG: AAA family ATPase [Bacteroidales bacterium]|nr:AAA family ATPase [Bacteroidales bacterium]
MNNIEVSKIFYDKELDQDIYNYLDSIKFNPLKSRINVNTEKIENFLCSFLGLNSLQEEQPNYINDILKTSPNIQRIFIMVAYIFFSKDVFDFFLSCNLIKCKGICNINEDDNILFLLLKYSGATLIQRDEFSINYTNALCSSTFGKSLKQLLILRFQHTFNIEKYSFNDELFYEICKKAELNKALGLDFDIFQNWLEGNNLGNYIYNVEITDFICIENIQLNFEESKEIYILGENGDGKSLILDAIFITFAGRVIEEASSKDASSAIDMLKNSRSSSFDGFDKLRHYGTNSPNILPKIFAYGTHRGRISSIETADKLGFMTLFDTEITLVDPSAWIKEVRYRELSANKNETSSTLASNNSVIALQNVFDKLLDKKVEIKIDDEIKYIENGALVNFSELSEGYRTTLIFVCDLLYRFYKYKMEYNSNGIFSVKGVVLIDEIDAHLHPRWQRTIVSRLRLLFPNVQFIMTTHSPHIIQGASQDAIIFRAYRDEKGCTCVSEPYLRNNLNDMMINTLTTSPLFGLEDARMQTENDNSDTSDTYLISKIERFVREDIANSSTKTYISSTEIDDIIARAKQKILSEKH